ncbi:MAG TPA: TonB-dependent receptor, partial [Bacteroidia bacterium]|nr:TonB-dependent receptor [Bacteroidia bacterium]
YMNPGIIEGDRDSITGEFIKPVAVNDTVADVQFASNDDFKSYSNNIPFQKINHYKAVLNNNFVIGDGSLKAVLGFQQNRRKEFGDVLNPDEYGLYFLLNTVNYDFRYIFPEKNHYSFTIGINGMYQSSQNKGSEFLVPEYTLFDAGIFGVVHKSYDKLDISGGIRYDIRNQNGENLFLNSEGEKTNDPLPGDEQKFFAFEEQFKGVSGSLGATYQLSEIMYTKLNVSRGFRAPNIAELGSNGEHEGSGRYGIGDPGLKSESSLQWDFAFGINSNHVTGELNLFSNSINNFIFTSKLSSFDGGDSLNADMPVYKFTSGDANLTGGEISIDIHPHPLDWLHFENTFSYVNATQKHQPDSSKYLPFTPAPKLTSELMGTTKKL